MPLPEMPSLFGYGHWTRDERLIVMRRSLLISVSALALVASTIALPPASAAPPVLPNEFGLHLPGIANGERPATKFGTVRLWDSGVAWGQVQQARNRYWWNGMDAAISNANEQGVDILYVLGGTPTWAATNKRQGRYPNRGAASVPRLQEWRAWVDAVTRRYGDSIQAYQIWNEANLTDYWAGSPREMAVLTREAYRIIKRNDPTAKVVSASSTVRLQSAYNRFFPAYLKELRKMRWPVDVISVHTYPENTGTPETRVGYVKQVNADLRKARVPRTKELWDTEVNYGLAGPGAKRKKRNINPTTGAAWVAQTYLDNLLYNVDRAYWYFWFRNSPILGIQMNDGLPAAQAFSTVQGWLAGSYYSCTEGRVNVCNLGDNVNVRTVAWASTRTGPYTVPAGVTTQCDALNQCRPAVPGSTVTIGAMPIWFGNPTS
jgi:polysaccharide biosynthesis protein PslG